MSHIFRGGLLTAAVLLSSWVTPGAEPAMPAREATPVLAELFTSEGCSSCPPADRLLAELDRTQPVKGAHIIVLSEHVDYWNDLGWKDPFSSPAFTARQREYAGKLDDQGLYTPQLVIDGQASFVGSDRTRAENAIAHAASRNKIAVRITGTPAPNGANVSVELPGGAPARSVVYLAVASLNAQSSVKRGENAGRELAHVSVVRQIEKLGTAMTSMPFSASHLLTKSSSNGKTRLIALVQDARSLRIIGIAEQDLGISVQGL